MKTPPSPPIERVAWFDGSPLTERDLADAVAHESRMLELHVRAVHATWGVANGLSVLLSGDSREALVTPGFAYTCRGDALVVPDLVRTAPSPALVGTAFDLVLGPPIAPEAERCGRALT